MITNNTDHDVRPTAAPTGDDEPESIVAGRDGTNQPTGVRTNVE
jgi:hypothetical protein